MHGGGEAAKDQGSFRLQTSLEGSYTHIITSHFAISPLFTFCFLSAKAIQ